MTTIPRLDNTVKRFQLDRSADPSAVSGVGIVADGVQFPDGTVVIRWRGDLASTVVWSSIEDAAAIHGWDGYTRIEWIDS